MADAREKDLAEAFAAARLIQEQYTRWAGETSSVGGRRCIPASRILAYATSSTQVSDMAIERGLRSEVGVRALYLAALSGSAVAESPVALAASEATITERHVGETTLRLASEAGVDWLILILAATTTSIQALEIRTRGGEGLRLRLPAPIDGVVQLPLDPAFPEMVAAAVLLRDPQTRLYLL